MNGTYSQEFPEIFNESDRLRIGKQILGIIKSQFEDLSRLRVLDVGCSGGEITNLLSQHVREIVGIDIDSAAIRRAKEKYKNKNLLFLEYESEFPFRENSFDLVVCNQVYEFVEDQQKFSYEIYRVLKSGGICVLGARNKWAFVEGQTGLPLINFLPSPVAKAFAKLLGRNYYPANYLDRAGLLKLFRRFEIEDLTLKILRDPNRFGFSKLEKYSFLARLFPDSLIGFIPNFFFLCRKP